MLIIAKVNYLSLLGELSIVLECIGTFPSRVIRLWWCGQLRWATHQQCRGEPNTSGAHVGLAVQNNGRNKSNWRGYHNDALGSIRVAHLYSPGLGITLHSYSPGLGITLHPHSPSLGITQPNHIYTFIKYTNVFQGLQKMYFSFIREYERVMINLAICIIHDYVVRLK